MVDKDIRRELLYPCPDINIVVQSLIQAVSGTEKAVTSGTKKRNDTNTEEYQIPHGVSSHQKAKRSFLVHISTDPYLSKITITSNIHNTASDINDMPFIALYTDHSTIKTVFSSKIPNANPSFRNNGISSYASYLVLIRNSSMVRSS